MDSEERPVCAESIHTCCVDHFALNGDTRVTFHVQGMHDNYLVQSHDKKFIFRCYRSGLRSVEAIQFELALLDALRGAGCPVSAPLATREGLLSVQLNTQIGALFPFAPGAAPAAALSHEQARLLADTVAKMHQTADGIALPYARQELNLEHLLDDSLAAVAPFLNQDQREYLNTLSVTIHQRMPHLPKAAPCFGICSGDINPSNFHLSDRGQITLFDFDQCGYGWRAFEIGKFLSSIHHLEQYPVLRDGFLQAYTAVRPLSAQELEAVPFFLLASLIWVMAINVRYVNLTGAVYLTPAFWERKLAALRAQAALILP